MFIGKIEDLILCNDLKEEDVKSILDFVNKNDLSTLEDGKYELNDENYVNVFHFTPKPEGGKFESHRKYLDVQYLVQGKEFMKWSNINNCTPINEFDFNRDIRNYTCPDELCDSAVLDGTSIVFNPNDVHAPGFSVGTPSIVKKVVFKIKVK